MINKPKYNKIVRYFNLVSRALFRTTSKLGYKRTLEAIEKLAKVILETDTEEDVWLIGENGDCTLGSMIIGAYWFCSDYHNGQNSLEYRVFSILSLVFKPGCTSGPEDETTEKDVYEMLELLYQREV